MKQKIEIEIDVPDGYEATGEYRDPARGELVLSRDSGEVVVAGLDWGKNFILRKVKRYRTPTLPDDGNKQVEVLDSSGQWVQAQLRGWRAELRWIAWTKFKGEAAYSDCRIEVTE